MKKASVAGAPAFTRLSHLLLIIKLLYLLNFMEKLRAYENHGELKHTQVNSKPMEVIYDFISTLSTQSSYYRLHPVLRHLLDEYSTIGLVSRCHSRRRRFHRINPSSNFNPAALL
jgi:hypothetical protein